MAGRRRSSTPLPSSSGFWKPLKARTEHIYLHIFFNSQTHHISARPNVRSCSQTCTTKSVREEKGRPAFPFSPISCALAFFTCLFVFFSSSLHLLADLQRGRVQQERKRRKGEKRQLLDVGRGASREGRSDINHSPVWQQRS